MTPKMKSEIAISYLGKSIIDFFATPDAASDMAQFGKVTQAQDQPNKYWLYVDARYDFQEVVAYIENYVRK